MQLLLPLAHARAYLGAERTHGARQLAHGVTQVRCYPGGSGLTSGFGGLAGQRDPGDHADAEPEQPLHFAAFFAALAAFFFLRARIALLSP